MKKIYLLLFSLVFITKGYSVTYTLNATGSPTLLSSWSSVPNSTAPTSFSGTNTWSILAQTNVSVTQTWNIGDKGLGDGSNGATIHFGNNTTAINFSLMAAIQGTDGSQPQFNIRAFCKFAINFNFNFNTSRVSLTASSTVTYNDNASNIVSFSSNYSNLTINSTTNLINSSAVIVNSVLTVNTGKKFQLNGNSLTIASSGSLAGAGTITGSSTSKLLFTGTGAKGTLILTSNNAVLAELNLGMSSATSSLTLGSDLTIDDQTGAGVNGLTLSGGILNLNGKKLTVDNTNSQTVVDFNGGTIMGSTTSSLELNAQSVVNGNFQMTSGTNTLSDLVMNIPNGNITIGSNSLSVYDFVRVTDGTITAGGNLIIVGSSGHNGAVDAMGATGAISGNVVVNSFFAAGTTGWCLMGTNGVSGKTIGSWDNLFPITCNGCTNGPVNAGNFFSVQDWDESTCLSSTNVTSSSALSAGKGYWVYLGSGLGSSTALNWSFTGPINQQQQTISGTGSGGGCNFDDANLFANPYPCPLNLNLLDGDNNANYGTYYTYARSGTESSWNAGSGTNDLAGNIIPVGVGFFATNLVSSSASFIFNETSKVVSATSAMFKPASQQDIIRLHVKGQYDANESILRIDASSSKNLDKKDAPKLFSTPGYGAGASTYSLYTTISSYEPQSKKYLAINTFPPSSQNQTLQILVRVSTSGSYTLSASDFDNYSSCAVLHDKLTNKYTDLKLNDYVCNINDTTSTPRFELLVCGSGVEPLSVTEFYASNNMSINQDADGIVVQTNYKDNTKSIVSVYNLLGQQMVSNVELTGTETKHFNLSNNNQVLLVKVTNDKESIAKKVLVK